MSYDELLRLARERRSVRSFTDQPVSDETLQDLFEVARWAPSAGNRQAYRLVVVRSRAVIDEMAQATRQAAEKLARRARDDLEGDYTTHLETFLRFADAPVVVVPIFRAAIDLLEPDKGPTDRLVMEAISSVSAAVMNLLLAAHARGLGASWMTGPLIAVKSFCQQLGVPEGWQIAAVVPLGYPAQEPDIPSRRPIDELVHIVE